MGGDKSDMDLVSGIQDVQLVQEAQAEDVCFFCVLKFFLTKPFTICTYSLNLPTMCPSFFVV